MGALAILAFVILGSAQDVFLGHLFVDNDPVLFAFYTFLVALIFLQIGFFIKRPNLFSEIVANKQKLLILNVITAMNWLSFFVALKYAEPAIVGAITFSMGPVLTTALGRRFNPESPPPSARAWIAAVGIIVASIFLTYCSLSGNSSLVSLEPMISVLGISLSVLAGAGMTINIFLSKTLSATSLTTQTITSLRFVLLVLTAGLIAFFTDTAKLPFIEPVFGISILAVAFLGIILPMTLVQVGIKKCEPRIVSVLLSLTPAVTLLFEAFDHRLSITAMSIVGILLSCGFTVMGSIKK